MNIKTTITLKFLLIAIVAIFCSASFISAQVTRISGKVTDVLTNEPVPFCNVFLKGTTQGTTTNFDGFFKIESTNPSDSLTASFLGYIPVSLKVKKGQEQTINFLIKQNKFELKEAVVFAGENPANILIKKIIANRDKNNYENLNSYQFEVYNKLEFDITNISEKFKSRKLFKPFAFIFDNIDSTTSNEKPFLPMFLTESLSDRYFSNNPKDKREVIKASKISGLENETVTQFLGDMYQNINIYENFMNIFGKNFCSPISNIGLLYYKYYLLDSLLINDKWCYKIKFKPRRPQELAFVGELFVHDTTFAIKKISMRATPEANINFVEDLAVVKEFDFIDNTMWMLTKDLFVVDFAAKDDGLGFIGRKATSYKNFVLNQPLPQEILKGTQDIIVKENSSNYDENFWLQNRHDSLAAREQKIYAMVDTIKSLPAFRTYLDIITLIFTGYKEIGKIELGPYYTILSNNSIEGYRIRLGGRTSANFSSKLRLEGYSAYGTKDEEFKFGAGARYWYNTKQREGFGVYYKQDVIQLGQSENAFQDDNFLASLFRRSPSDKLTSLESYKVYYEKEWKSGFSGKITFQKENFSPLGSLDYRYYTNDVENDVRSSINTSNISLFFRFAYREKFVEGKTGRVSLGSTSPVLRVNYTRGLKGVLASDFDYQKITAKVDDYLYFPPFGYLYYVIESGKVFGTVPYPLLEVHRGNESYFYDYAAFNLMNYYEFVSDQYVVLNGTYHFEGFFLDKIPLLRKLKWREVATAKAVYGNLDKKNLDILVSKDQFTSLSKKPYIEAGFGVENILKVIRVDFLYRLSYLDRENIPKFGIRGSLMLAF